MNAHPSSENSSPHRFGGVKQGLAWIAQGFRLVQEQKTLWYGMTAVYFLLGFLLKWIPFMGDLLLILITPMLLAGVVWGLAHGHTATGGSPENGARFSGSLLFQTCLARPARELLRIFNQEEKAFGAVLLGIVTLGFIMLVQIVGYLLIGGSMLTGLTAGQMGEAPFTTLLGMLVLAVLYLILTMGLLFSVPLTVLGNRPPLAAIAEGFSVCRQYPVPLLTLVAPFLGIYLVIKAALAEGYWLGELLGLGAGFVALPVFVAAVYCSYLTLYPLDEASLRR